MADKKFELPPDLPPLSALELLSIIPLRKAADLSSLCEDTLEEEYADKIVQLSPKRRGMRLGHALMLGRKKSA
jgi:hypothetical protein